MAVLQKLRTKFGLAISIIVALGLLSFIVDPGQIQSAVQSMSSKYDVGNINGKSISYADFQADIDRFTTINEVMTGTSVSSEEQQQQVRNSAWQSLIDKHLFLKAARAAGITVGEEEMLSLTTGATPSPVLTQLGAFNAEDGSFDPSLLVNFVQSIDTDETGNLRLFWNYLQNTIYTQQYYTKYGSLFTNSAYQNPLQLKNAVAENNQTSDVDFVMVPLTFTPDSSIVVSDSEIKNYYKTHKDFFKQNASRDIEYVVYEVVPSSDDIAATNDQISEVYDEFLATDNMKAFLLRNSERALSSYWYKDGELNVISTDINNYVFSGDEGGSGIVSSGNTFLAARVMNTAMVSDSVYVKHILLTGADAAHVADSLLDLASRKDANFSNLAALNSTDQSSAADGELGNIGWMTQTYMIPGFESVIDAELNKPFILNTQYGTHVVLVTEKTAPVLKKQVAILEKTAVPSNATYNEMYAKANKFASIAKGNYSNYRAAVDSMSVYSHPMRIAESTSVYGVIDNAKEVTRWAFDNKAGKVSDIITVNQNFFFIATVTGTHDEGYATVSEAAATIKDQLYSEKAAEKLAQDVAAKISGLTTLEAVAEALGTSVSSQSAVTFAAMGASTLDPKFIGALSVAPQDKICGPVAGSIGAYVFKVTGRDTGSFYTEDDAAMYEAQKNSYNSQMILPIMMDDADVKDNRARFF